MEKAQIKIQEKELFEKTVQKIESTLEFDKEKNHFIGSVKIKETDGTNRHLQGIFGEHDLSHFGIKIEVEQPAPFPEPAG